MYKSIITIVLVALCGTIAPLNSVWAQTEQDITAILGEETSLQQKEIENMLGANANQNRLFSPSVGNAFYELAYNLSNIPDADQDKLKQAIVLLKAASQLDEYSQKTIPMMINVATKQADVDNSELLFVLLQKYLTDKCNLEVARKAVSYILSKQQARQDREDALKTIITYAKNKNTAFDSQILTQLGMLTKETGDVNNATGLFIEAYNLDNYNKTAFDQLYSITPDIILPSVHLENMRRQISQDPYNLENGLVFAQYAEKLQLYHIAAGTYEYAASLFKYLYPSEPLPEYIYIPWTLCAFNSELDQDKCLQIAKILRSNNQFDMLVEVIASKASINPQSKENAQDILSNAETRLLANWHDPSVKVPAEQMAWFYTFAMKNFDKAIDYANKGYSDNPDSAAASAILAYLLIENDQIETAETLIKNTKDNQIADLAKANMQLKKNQIEQALNILKESIEKKPNTLESSIAKKMLIENGSEYVPTIDTQAFSKAIEQVFQNTVIPEFISADKRLALQISLKGSKFAYDHDLKGQVIITNNAEEPFKINDDAMIKGNIRIDARVYGDIEKYIPNLITKKMVPSNTIDAKKSLVINVNLLTGELEKILKMHPQASLKIDFTTYLDPVENASGQIVNNLSDIKPATVTVQRTAVKLTTKFLQNRFSTLAKGKQGQKIKICQLFAGLLIEQITMTKDDPLYKYKTADWMPKMLRSAILSNLKSNDWITKTHAMNSILDLQLDSELMDTISNNINDSNWPVRMIALMILKNTSSEKFSGNIDWASRHDENPLVREMAIALGADKPQTSTPDNNEMPVQ